MAIDLRECINVIERGEWFTNLHVITANVAKGTGGKLLVIPKARIARKSHAGPSAKPGGGERSANHAANFTRNIELPNKRVITIHPILITQINNQSLV